MRKKVSIIIRTKNEERWISSCLDAVFSQNYDNYEVIIVDNESTDRTLEKARKFPVEKYVTIKEYLPGRSLNEGIRNSSGDYIVCLSGHCIPVNEKWLENLVSSLEKDNNAAGVYGRQEPMTFSSAADKRDLIIVFGLDRRVQVKDSFFHNANSIIKKELWDKVCFDENITNIEDRIWAQKMLELGYCLIYEPTASVYHYHGIHQNGNEERCNNVVKIIEDLHSEIIGGGRDNESLSVIAIIPIRGKTEELHGIPQMKYTINSALASKYISDVIVTTDNEDSARIARELGASVPFLRPESLSKDYVGLESVLKYTLEHIEENGVYPDIIVLLEETYPFREDGMIDSMVEHLLAEGLDSVVAARRETNCIWQEDERGSFQRYDSGDVPRLYKEKTYLGVEGLCTVTHPEFIRQERKLGHKVGLYEIDSQISFVEVRDKKAREIAAKYIV